MLIKFKINEVQDIKKHIVNICFYAIISIGSGNMDEKYALVTGASKGIGEAIAKRLAKSNYNIIISYNTDDVNAKRIKQEIESETHAKVMIIKCDISNEKDILNMHDEVIKTYGRLDCLVNNAAMCSDNYFYDKTKEEFDKIIQTNLTGTFMMCKIFGNSMLNNKHGKIINISSTNGIDTNETYSMDYDASKAGIISLTKNFAKALAPYITVNSVAPGWTNTTSVKEMEPKYIEREKEKILLRRFAEPCEIANVVNFLASEEASYINGEVIRVDGGY